MTRTKSRRSCGKRRFRDKGEAIRSLHTIRTKGVPSPKGTPSRAYFCDHCKGWHLTSQGGRAS